MTESEAILWKRLRTNQLGGFHFRRQQIIDGAIVDFYCHAAGLIIEIDGPIHDFQWHEDQEREKVLIDKGFKILRIKNSEIEANIENVLVKILAKCESLKEKPSGLEG